MFVIYKNLDSIETKDRSLLIVGSKYKVFEVIYHRYDSKLITGYRIEVPGSGLKNFSSTLFYTTCEYRKIKLNQINI